MKIFKSLLVSFALATIAASIVLVNSADARAQDKAPATTSPQKVKGTYTLSTRRGAVRAFTLKSKDAKLSEITADLSKRLKVPVFLSPLMEKQLVTVDFTDLTLEPALQLLAPQVFVDYQVSLMQQQVPLGIYLWAHNEAPPAINAVVPSSTQALLIEGDTEEGVEPTTEEAKRKLEEKPLRITFSNQNLTVRARKQPLTLVVLKVGEELGVPVEIKEDSKDEITTDIVSVPWEDAIQRLSPNIRIYVRADLTRVERRPLRMVLVAPRSESQTSIQSQ